MWRYGLNNVFKGLGSNSHLNIKISWPLNNFIQQEHLPSYSKIQRFLLRLKRAKYVMEKKTLFRGRIKMEKSDVRAMRFYSIRMRILWFINAFWRYIMTTVSFYFHYKFHIIDNIFIIK
jgi:hypothetical protein